MKLPAMSICHDERSENFPPVGDGGCCYGELMHGPSGCTCWREVYDLQQADPDPTAVRLLAAGVHPVVRRHMCADCAYRPDSPEKSGDPSFQGDTDELERIAGAERFWCHEGIRRVVAWRHPEGAEAPAHPGAYQPPIVAGVPYRADGSPAELCAGWSARRRALVAAGEAQP